MNTRARPKQMLSSHKPGAQSLTDRSQNSHVYFSEVNLALLSFFWPDSCVGLTKGPPQPFFERQMEAQCGLHALNNALACTVFTKEDLQRACSMYLERSDDLASARAEHIRPGGQLTWKPLSQLGSEQGIWETGESVSKSCAMWKASYGATTVEWNCGLGWVHWPENLLEKKTKSFTKNCK